MEDYLAVRFTTRTETISVLTGIAQIKSDLMHIDDDVVDKFNETKAEIKKIRIQLRYFRRILKVWGDALPRVQNRHVSSVRRQLNAWMQIRSKSRASSKPS